MCFGSQALTGLKKAAFAHAAALAAEKRGQFETQVRWEMQRLDQEIQNMSRRLRECSQEVSAVEFAAKRQPLPSSTPCYGGTRILQNMKSCV